MRRVKIVATLGPAVAGREKLRELLQAGVDMVRINAAHGTMAARERMVEDTRAVAEDLGLHIPILLDLKGLKIRTGPLSDGEPVPFARGSTIEVFPEAIPTAPGRIGIDYPKLLEVTHPNSRMIISDGLIELMVESVQSDRLVCQVGRGGLLLARQGVTLPDAPITGGSMTADDRLDVEFAVRQGIDYLGLSFINEVSDLVMAKEVAAGFGGHTPALIAKIERPEALKNVRDIALHADGLMVARGDLGVQLPPERVPRAQKKIIAVGNELGVPVITATQMLESMITQPMATRAETSDVANAVWDGTDAVMLSAETAVGRYPIEAVETMNRVILEAEKDGPVRTIASSTPRPASGQETSVEIAEAIAQATFAMAEYSPAELVVVFTLTGANARRVAKYRPKPPIVAVTTLETTARLLNVVWAVRAIVVPLETDPELMFRIAGKEIIAAGRGNQDAYALIVASLPMMRQAGRTNLIHIRRLGT